MKPLNDSELREQIDKYIEYMAMCIGESKDERRDDVGMIFMDMENDIMQLIVNHDRQLLQTIRSRLPEKPRHNKSTSWEAGYDDCWIDVTTILDEIKGEIK